MTTERETNKLPEHFTEMRLVKIVYGYDINRDGIKAKQYYRPIEGEEEADICVYYENAVDCTMDVFYTPFQWEDQLYALAEKNSVDLVKAVDELVP